MGFWDAVSDIGVGDIIEGVGSIISAGNRGGARDSYADALRGQAQYNYDIGRAQHDSYNQYLSQADAIRAGNAGIEAENAAGAAAVANANARAIAAANVAAGKVLAKRHKRTQKMLKPGVKAFKELMPLQTDIYKSGMKGVDMLKAYLERPSMWDQMNNSKTPLLGQDLGTLPDNMIRK